MPAKMVGEVEWTVYDHHGNMGVIRTLFYDMPKAKIRLFSPQTYLRNNNSNGACFLTKDYCLLDLECGKKLKFIYDKYNDFPMAPTAPPFSPSSNLATVIDPLPEGVQVNAMLHNEANQNLTRAQKDLLHWHWRLGHASQKRVQGLMRKNVHTAEQIIVPTVKKAASCFRPLCTACRLARAHCNLTHLLPRHPAPDMLIRANDLLPGDCASVDQYVCHTRGRLPNTKGKEKDQKRYCGGLIAVNHASGFIHLTNQVSLYGGEAVKAKHSFEHLARGFGFSI